MTGLDPVGRKQVRDLILSLRDCGKTVFFSTHIPHDVEMICDRVGIVMKGPTGGQRRVDELRAGSYTIGRSGPPTASRSRGMRSFTLATRVLQQGQQCLIVLPSPDAVDALVGEIRRQGGQLLSITRTKRRWRIYFSRGRAGDHAGVAAYDQWEAS